MVVIDTVQKLLERGENLEDLNDRTQVLLEQSEHFEERVMGQRRSRSLLGRSTRLLSALGSGIRWTARQTSALFFLVLYYIGRAKNTGAWILSVLFPIHDGMTIERYNTFDVYHDPYYVELEDEEVGIGWQNSISDTQQEDVQRTESRVVLRGQHPGWKEKKK
jgi:hypothetical protein